MIKLLLDREADTRKADEDGYTPLEVAEINNQEDVVNLLKRNIKITSTRMGKRGRICHYYNTEFCDICDCFYWNLIK